MVLFGIVVAIAGIYYTVQQVRIARGMTEPKGWPYLQTESVVAQYVFAGGMAALALVITFLSVA